MCKGGGKTGYINLMVVVTEKFRSGFTAAIGQSRAKRVTSIHRRQRDIYIYQAVEKLVSVKRIWYKERRTRAHDGYMVSVPGCRWYPGCPARSW